MSRHCGWRAAALALVIIGAGCADGGPTTVPAPQFSETSDAGLDVTRVAMYRGASPPNGTSATAWIGPEGGTLRLLGIEVVVPPGAVTSLTKFRIKLPVDPKKALYAVAEFQPHNVTFHQPVTLRLPYQGTTAEGLTPSVIWWDGSSWIRYQTTLLPDGRVETTTDHFSFFGTELCLLLLCAPGITPVGG